jgi:hypothetical protein
MRPLHIAVLLVTLALVGCGDATARESPSGNAPPPIHDAAIVISEAEDGRVAAGQLFRPGL